MSTGNNCYDLEMMVVKFKDGTFGVKTSFMEKRWLFKDKLITVFHDTEGLPVSITSQPDETRMQEKQANMALLRLKKRRKIAQDLLARDGDMGEKQ